MRFVVISAFLAVLLSRALGWSAEGFIVLRSPYRVEETIERLETVVKGKGMAIFARVDHAAGAAKVGKKLRPTMLLIFGNPQGGTPFMECTQSVGIDLPLKALAWQDATGAVWLGYNDPAFIAQRHGVPNCQVVQKMSKALKGLVQESVAK